VAQSDRKSEVMWGYPRYELGDLVTLDFGTGHTYEMQVTSAGPDGYLLRLLEDEEREEQGAETKVDEET
jgi:hypothetical protein